MAARKQLRLNCGCVKYKEVDYCPYHRGYEDGYEDAKEGAAPDLPFLKNDSQIEN